MQRSVLVLSVCRAAGLRATSVRPPPCLRCLDLARQRRYYAGAAAVAARPPWGSAPAEGAETSDPECAEAIQKKESTKVRQPQVPRSVEGSTSASEHWRDSSVLEAAAAISPEPLATVPVSSGSDKPSPPDPSTKVDDALEAELDALAEGHRTRFTAQASSEMPGLTDVEALRPRMKSFVVGMSPQFYTDRYHKTVSRLSRAFTKSQLRHLLEDVLGYRKKAVPQLTAAGRQRLAGLKAEGHQRDTKDLVYAVMAEKPAFSSPRKFPLGRNLMMRAKRELCEWIASSHWELPHPASIPQPATMAQRAASQLVEAEMYKMPYPELFLIQQQEDTMRSLSSTAHELGIVFEVSAEGILIRGPLTDRVAFQRQVARQRKSILNRTLDVPKSLVGAAVTPELLMALGRVSGAYVETAPEGGGLKAYADTTQGLERVAESLLQLATNRSVNSSIPLMLAPASQAVSTTPSLCLLPFVPRYRPAWPVASLASSYGRFTYPKHLPSRSRNEGDGTIFALASSLACLRGDVSDLLEWLLDVPSHEQLGDLRLRATFGHLLYTRPDVAAMFGPQFTGEDAAVQLALWHQSVEPPPYFAPGPLYPDLAPPAPVSPTFALQDGSALQEADAEELSVRADEARQVHVFSPVGSPDSDLRALESYRVSMPRRELRVQRIVQRRAVVMLPEHPLDLMFTAERRSKDEAGDPTGGAYTRGATSFSLDGRRFVRTDLYTSQHVRWATAPSLIPGIQLRHERRRNLSLASPAPYLRGELLATAGDVSVGDFYNTALRLASGSPNGASRNQ